MNRRPRSLRGPLVLAAVSALAGCATPAAQGVQPATELARQRVLQLESELRHFVAAGPPAAAVTQLRARLAPDVEGYSGHTRVVVLAATPAEPNALPLAVFSTTDGPRDGDPFGRWTVLMCARLEARADATVQAVPLTCPVGIPNPNLPTVDATVAYHPAG